MNKYIFSGKIMKIFFLYIYSIIFWFFWWVIAIITISMGIIIAFFLPRRFKNFIGKIISKILLYCAFIIPKHKGINPKDLPFPVIFTPNHVSFFDLFLSGAVLPGYPRGLQLKKFFPLPVYGWLISFFGMIPIETGSIKSVKNSFKKVLDILNKKERNILIMPEGERTLTGNVNKFRSGAFLLSMKSGVPVVPVVFKGLFKINNRTGILIKPGIVDVVLLDPVYPKDFAHEYNMAEYVKDKIIEELKK